MTDYKDAVKAFTEAAKTDAAVQNMTTAGELTADQAARAYRLSRGFGEPMPTTVDTMEDLNRRFATNMAVDAAQDPFTRNLMADAVLSRLLYDKPEEWGRLTVFGKLAASWSQGRAQKAQNEAAGESVMPDAEDINLLSAYDLDSEADTATSDSFDSTFLTKWAQKADSPFLNTMRKRDLQRKAEVEQRRNEAAIALMAATEEIQHISQNATVAALEGKDATEVMAEMAKHPIDIGVMVTLQSLAMGAEGYVGAGLAAPISPLLAVGAIGNTSFQNEYGSKVVELLQEKGVDLTSYDQIRAALNNPELMQEIGSKALVRGITVATFDSLTAGMSSFTLRPASRLLQARGILDATGRFAQKNPQFKKAIAKATPWFPHAEDLVAHATLDAAGGAAGEYLGAKAIGEEASAADILLEAFSGATTAPVDIMSMRSSIIRQATTERLAAARAIKRADTAERMIDAQAQSEFAKQAPEAFAEQAQKAVEGTTGESITVNPEDVRTFKQEIFEAAPDVAKTWDEAELTGGDIKLTMAELLKVASANPELAKEIVRKGRFGDDAMSLEEAQLFEKNFAPGLEEKVRELVSKQVAYEKDRHESRAAVRSALAPMREQLLAAGKGKDEVDAQMAIEASILENLAEISGMTPAELLAANPVRVERAEGPQGETLHQDDGAKDEGDGGAPAPDGKDPEGKKKEGKKRGKVVTRGEYTQGILDPKSHARTESTIRLFKESNVSTFLHESAHYWLDTMIARASAALANMAANKRNATGQEQKLLDLVSDVLDFAVPALKGKAIAEKIKSWQNLDKSGMSEGHEKFARGFEAYLRQGNLPANENSKLGKAFLYVSRWLRQLYTEAAQLGVTMSPEVISLYDRLFAVDEAIAEARDRMNDNDLYDDLVKQGMTPEEFALFVALKDDAAAEARGKLFEASEKDAQAINDKLARETKGVQTEYRNIFNQFKEELTSIPGYRALRAFSYYGIKGKDGTRIRLKLDPSVLEDPKVSEQDKTFIRKRQLDYRPDKTVEDKPQDTDEQVAFEDDKATPDGKKRTPPPITVVGKQEAIDLLGFDSFDQLMLAMRAVSLVNAVKHAEYLAKQEFRLRHGEAATEEGFRKVAAGAIHTATRLRVLATETAALRGAMRNAEQLRSAVAAFARENVGRMTFAEVRPNGTFKFLTPGAASAAARRAARKAEKLFKEGKPIEAAEAKQAQLIQETTVVEIKKAQEMAKRFGRRCKKLLKSDNMDGAYKEQILLFLGRLGYAIGNPSKDAPTLAAFVDEHPEIMEAYNALPESLRDYRGPWETLTVGEIRALDRFFEQMARQGRSEKALGITTKYEAAAETLDITDRNLAENRDKKPKEATETNIWGKRKGMLFRYFYQHMRFASLIRIIEGKEGPLTKALIWRANDIDAEEKTLRQEIAGRVLDIFAPMTKKINEWNKKTITYKGVRYSRHNLFAIALNAGNAGNLNRLEKGNGLTLADVTTLMGLLTKDELERVQRIWDVFESLRVMSAKVYRAMDGMEPEWVEPQAITIKSVDGATVELKGGYVPITYDPEISDKARLRQLQTELNAQKEAGVVSAQTSRTYTKTRMLEGETGMAVQLDTEGALAGMREIIHDIVWREFIQDANRLYRGVTTVETIETIRDGKIEKETARVWHPGLGQKLTDYFGADASKIVQDWIKQIAFDGRIAGQQASDHWAGMIRRNVSLSGLGFNVVSALVQTTGLITAATEVGVVPVLRGLARLVADRKNIVAQTNVLSKTMVMRSTTRIREIDEVSNLIVESRHEKVETFKRLAYGMMMAVQGVVDYSVWQAAFEEAVARGESQANAARIADQTVIATQGSGSVKDRSQMEQGRVMSIFTSFYSYMGTALNLGMVNYLGEKDRVKAWTNIATIFVLQPCIEALLREALTPGDDGDDGDDDSSFLEKSVRFVGGNSIEFTMGTLLGVREAAGIAGLVSGEQIYAYRGPSSLRAISDFLALGQQVQQGEADAALAKALVNLLGDLGGLPSAQLNRTISGYNALVNDDKTDNPLVLATGYKSK